MILVILYAYNFRYPPRWTEEAQKSVLLLEQLFGPEFYEHCIIVFTYGDVFKKNQQRNIKAGRPEETFEDYIRKQSGELGTLVRKVSQRAVLFDNFAEGDERKAMVDKLMKLTDEVTSKTGKKYTNDIFKEAQKMRRENKSEKEMQSSIFTFMQNMVSEIWERAKKINVKDVLDVIKFFGFFKSLKA